MAQEIRNFSVPGRRLYFLMLIVRLLTFNQNRSRKSNCEVKKRIVAQDVWPVLFPSLETIWNPIHFFTLEFGCEFAEIFKIE